MSEAVSPNDHEAALTEVKAWNESRVAEWLQSVNSASYATVFISNHINGDALLECDQRALKELGVKKVGDRVRLLVAIKALRAKCFGDRRPVPIASILSLDSPSVVVEASHDPPTSANTIKTVSSSATISKPSLSPNKARSPGADTVDSPLRSANGVSSLLSNCVKFIGEEGQTRIVNIVDCTETTHILEKALKKFGLSESITMDPTDRVENYCVFITSDVGPARQLDDEELLQICQDPARPERERLILKRKDSAPSILEFRQAQKIAKEQQALLKDQAMANNMGKLKKIGGFFGEMPSHIRGNSNSSSISSPLASPSAQQHPRGPKARIKEFFGARPPSELISSNLQEYFPEASTSVLEKTVRNSIRRSQRMSTASRSPYHRRQSDASAFSVASLKSLAPPVPTVGDAWISATSLPRKSRPGSIHRAPSIMSHKTTKSRKSVRLTHVSSESPPQDDIQTESFRSVSRNSNKSDSSDATYKEASSISASDEEHEDEADSVQFDLPEYLKEQLALTADEDEQEDGTVIDRENGLQHFDAQSAITGKSTSTVAQDNTGPSSWIKGTLIGQGSFGSVVLGMNALTGELMAVKQVDLPRSLASDRDLAIRKHTMLDALQREIALLRDLQHDNIVQYLGSNSDGTHLNIFLEYVPGGSVTEMLSKYGAFKEPLVRQFVRQILQGLNYLHERDIIHRDIKGGNILVDNKGVIKISDFGISKKVEPQMLSMPGSGNKNDHRPSLQGSIFWMAPEVVKQTQYTRKADIWSLGCLIVEMLTGEHPYPEYNQMQAIFRIGGADSAPDIPAGISADGLDFLSKTFELELSARPTASELLAHSFCHASVS